MIPFLLTKVHSFSLSVPSWTFFSLPSPPPPPPLLLLFPSTPFSLARSLISSRCGSCIPLVGGERKRRGGGGGGRGLGEECMSRGGSGGRGQEEKHMN